MKLCYSSLGCPGDSVEALIRRMQGLGAQGVELRTVGSTVDLWEVPDFSPERIADTRRKFEEAGLAVAVVGTGGSFADPKNRAAQMQVLKKYAAIAQGLGCRYLRVFGGPLPEGMTREQVLENDIAGYREALSMLEQYQVELLFETHDDFSRSEWMLPLVEALPGTGVVWDILHPYRFGEPMAQTWERLRPYIRHVHIKDSMSFGADHFDIAHIGEGAVPVSDALKLLKEAGYDGYLCYEWEKHWHPEIDGADAAFPRFEAFMKEYL